MSSLNKVQLIGRLGKDPEVRSFQNGGKVCNLNVATSERWRDKNTGEKRERTEWHRVTIHVDGLIGVAEQYLRKGSQVYLEGQIETRKWQDQSGADRYSTEVVLRPYRSTLVLLGAPGDGDGRRSGAAGSGGGDGGSAGHGLGDDDIPF